MRDLADILKFRYGATPHFETLAEADAACQALDYYAQLLGYGLLPSYCLQYAKGEFDRARDALAGVTPEEDIAS